jgi:hypothetical protein
LAEQVWILMFDYLIRKLMAASGDNTSSAPGRRPL